jgi:hypothetical protein
VADASDDEPADPDVPAGNEHCHDGAERIADEVERRGAGESQQQLKVLCHLRLAVVGGVMRRIGEAVAPRVECEHLVAGEDECADDPGRHPVHLGVGGESVLEDHGRPKVVFAPLPIGQVHPVICHQPAHGPAPPRKFRADPGSVYHDAV